MKRIEDCWDDTVSYYIQFETTKNKKVSKVIILDATYTVKEVEEIILLNFYQVKKVCFIEEVEECLSLKK